MKFSITVSASMHSAVIALALASFSTPAPLIALEDQGVEVDFAIDSDAESGKGEKKADVDPVPAPLPSQRPQTIEDAINAGEAREDSRSREGIVTDKTLDTEKTSAAPKAEKVVKAEEVEKDPVKAPDDTETPVPTTEVASLNETKTPLIEEVQPDEGLPAIDPDNDLISPTETPVPSKAPADRPKAKAAKTKERKKPEEVKRKKTATSTENRKEVTDKIGQLLNTQDNTAGGARREQRVASIGDPQANSAPQLTRGEYDALKGRVSQCWSLPSFVDLENLRVTVLLRMAREGYMDDIADISVSGLANPAHSRAVESSLMRNLNRRNCDFSDVLPGDKYETWKDVKINFEPRDF
ncbi:MAG: hypothetical protein ACR2O0_02765 [Rhizobiaceae bacterium]